MKEAQAYEFEAETQPLIMRSTQMIHKRPLIITAICIIGFAGGLIAIPMAFSPQAAAISRLYPPFLLLSAAFGLICFGGLWMMKRWGLIAYSLLAGASQATLFALGTWSATSVIVPGIVIAMSLFYYDKMEPARSQSEM